MLLICLLLLLNSFASAGTAVHYFGMPSCDANGLGDFNDTISTNDSACHVAPRNITRAIYIDDIDDNCSVITYSDYSCTPERARHKLAEKGVCFFSSAGGLLRSWRSVCGADRLAASISFASIRATATHAPTHVTVSSQRVPTSFSLTTWTATSTWTSWNGVSNTTLTSTSMQTQNVSVLAPVTTGGAKGHATMCLKGVLMAGLVLGGNMLRAAL